MFLYELQNPLLQVNKNSDLHCLVEVGLGKIMHNTENMSIQVECLVNTAQ